MSNRNGVWSLPAQYQAIADQDWTMAPGAPTGVSATAGSAEAEVSFTAPTFAGIPGTITQFKVTSSSGQTATGSTSPITVTGLTNGNAVTFTAQAQNAIGLGKASDASSSVTPLAEVISGLFSTHLYTGTASNQTITNGVNLSGKGGMVWIKGRNATSDHALVDTVRGGSNSIASNTTAAQRTDGAYGVTFNSNGFTSTGGNLNVNGREQVSWTFRKEPKFFDIVTWTGNGTEDRTISHNLGSVPGMIIVKGYSLTEDWNVYHRGIGNDKYLQLNSTAAAANVDTGVGGANLWMSTDPTSTTFKIDEHDRVNKNGDTYVAYLFAHNDNDGGFGPDSEDIIKCGSYTGNASGTGPEINLGFEPQWLFVKNADNSSSDWLILDVMRGWGMGDADIFLEANTTGADQGSQNWVDITSTGFKITNANGQINGLNQNHIYMAIRRPDMSTPTTPSDVFAAVSQAGGYQVNRKATSNFPVDFTIGKETNTTGNWYVYDRLRGGAKDLRTNLTNAEGTNSPAPVSFDFNDGIKTQLFNSSNTVIWHMWKRAKGYFDVVAYDGNGSNRTITHNLGAVPEMMWVKSRSNASHWQVYHSALGNTKYLELNNTQIASTNSARWNDTTPTSSVFTLGTDDSVNDSNRTYIAYLFATVAGVSKLGSYTGNSSSTQDIDCGFTNGAKMVILKQASHAESWEIYDTTRALVAGNDYRIRIDDTGAQATNSDFIDPLDSGFTAVADSNFDGRTYLFYAIANDPS